MRTCYVGLLTTLIERTVHRNPLSHYNRDFSLTLRSIVFGAHLPSHWSNYWSEVSVYTAPHLSLYPRKIAGWFHWMLFHAEGP